jgi:PGF-pre-PGF domain-containing protein
VPDYRYRKWTPLLFPAEEIDDGPDITVVGQVFSDIQEHSQTDRDKEVGGFLLGEVHWLPNQDIPIVWIDSTIRATHTNATSTRLEFTADTWIAFHQEREERFGDKKIILGWYHTHPGHGIFLSSHDTFIHEGFYTGQQQVALVVDPIRHQSGFFKWTSNGLDSHRYYGFTELYTSDDQSFNPGGNLSQDLLVGAQPVFPTEPEAPDILELPRWLSWIDKLPGSSLILNSLESSISRSLSLFSLVAFVSLIVFIIFASLVLGRLGNLTESVEMAALGSNADQSSGIITRTIPPLEAGVIWSGDFSSDSHRLAGLIHLQITPRITTDKGFEINVQRRLTNPVNGRDSLPESHVVYGYLQVSPAGLFPADIKKVDFEFVVPNDWLENYNIDPEEMRLWRFDEQFERYLELSLVGTIPSGNDSWAVTFTSPSLSYFALSGRIDSSAVSERTSALTSPVPPTAVPPTAVPPTCNQPDITQGATGSSPAGSLCNPVATAAPN